MTFEEWYDTNWIGQCEMREARFIWNAALREAESVVLQCRIEPDEAPQIESLAKSIAGLRSNVPGKPPSAN